MVAGLLTRDSQRLRDESATSQVEAISKVLGGRLDETDKSKVSSAFHSWSKGRGDWLAAGLMWSGSTRAAVVRAAGLGSQRARTSYDRDAQAAQCSRNLRASFQLGR